MKKPDPKVRVEKDGVTLYTTESAVDFGGIWDHSPKIHDPDTGEDFVSIYPATLVVYLPEK